MPPRASKVGSFMRQLASLALAVISLVFFVGSKCNSGDFTDSYIFCTPMCVDGNGNCLTDPSLCSAPECTTGLQQFLNGQNECNALEDDGINNDCGNSTSLLGANQTNLSYNILNQRINWFLNIGCTGGFAETNPVPSPSPTPSSS
jgi:hypothetical protein